jgi:DNA-binding MarR family transcriptional regulator
MIVRETGTDMSLFDDMTVFVRAVEAKSFSGAAQRLGLAKSVVSRRMASLEGRLGTRLFHRTTRRLSLTETGHAFYERARRKYGRRSLGGSNGVRSLIWLDPPAWRAA